MDAFAFENTRELDRKSLQLVLQDQIEKAEKYLKEFSGLAISENTIRKLYLEESQTMEDRQNNDAASHKPFREAETRKREPKAKFCAILYGEQWNDY